MFCYGKSNQVHSGNNKTPMVQMARAKKAKQKLGNVYSKYSGFKNEFNKLITEETCRHQFEVKWQKMIKAYSLQDN